MIPLLMLLVCGPATAALCTGLNWLSLRPWRKARDQHWTEQARVIWPARVAAQSQLWTTPIIAVLGVQWGLPESSSLYLTGIGFFSCLGAFFGSAPIDQAVGTHVTDVFERIRQTLTAFTITVLHWFALIIAAVVMPKSFDWRMLVITAAFIGFKLVWSRAGWAWIGRKLGLIYLASPRIVAIAQASSSKASLTYRHVWSMRSRSAQAYAFPQTRDLLFTERIAELLSDEELAAVCDHEVGHLGESRMALFIRTLNFFTVLPWIFLIPLVSAFGFVGFYIPILSSILLPRLFNAFSRRMEVKADLAATHTQTESGLYAQALLKIHQDNLIPAVYPGKHLSHPHLYDRMLACGVTPDFPRPAAPSTMSWTGLLLSIILGVLVGAKGFARMLH